MEEFHHRHQLLPLTLDAPSVSYPAAAGDAYGRYPAATSAPYGRYPAAAGDASGRYPAAPGAAYGRYPDAAGDPYGRYLAASGAPYGRYPAAPGAPYGRYLAAPGAPYSRYTAAAGDSYGRYLAAPGAPYGRYPAVSSTPAPGGTHLPADECEEGADLRRRCVTHACYGNGLRSSAACCGSFAALGVGGAPVPCFMDERQEASSFQDLSITVYWIVEPIGRRNLRPFLEGGCSSEEAAPVRLVRQRPTNDRADKYYIRCTKFPTDGAFRVRGVGWLIRRRPSVRSAAADGDRPLVVSHGGYSANSDDGLGAASHIFLVQPREGGVPPSRLRTLRQVPWSYWIMALRSWLSQRHCISATWYKIPRSWSWESLMGPPMYQRPDANGKYDGSCVICASATCIHALHRLGFERRYGAGSFPYELDPDLDYMKLACARAGAWTPVAGGGVGRVLKVMNHIGLRTRDVPGWESCVLRFVGSCVYSRIESSELEIATMIRETGPILGALFAGPNYKFTENNYVYRGEIGAVNHVVVCVAYDFVEVQHGVKELHIWILDNHRRKGPYRWILYEVFHKFTCIKVEAMNREELRISVGVPARSTEAARLLDLPKD